MNDFRKNLVQQAFDKLDINNAKPKIKLNQAYSSGPSGGLMQTLYIYDSITNYSISKDNYLLGTGTISTDGTIGKIGGVSQKVMTANYYLVDYFFVPKDNYSEALEKYNTLKDPSFKLVSVETIEDAINAIGGKK